MSEGKCKHLKDKICVNSKCPIRKDFCPVIDAPQLCRYADMELEFELKINAFKMNGDEAIGLITDGGFTLEFQDKDGNPIPLNKKNVEKFLEHQEEGNR